MRTADLKELSDAKLEEQVANARRELFGLRMKHATGELENTGRLRTLKRELARALTIARQRGLDSNATSTESTHG